MLIICFFYKGFITKRLIYKLNPGSQLSQWLDRNDSCVFLPLCHNNYLKMNSSSIESTLENNKKNQQFEIINLLQCCLHLPSIAKNHILCCLNEILFLIICFANNFTELLFMTFTELVVKVIFSYLPSHPPHQRETGCELFLHGRAYHDPEGCTCSHVNTVTQNN